MRGPALDPAHEIADRNVRRYLDEQVDMLARQNARYDLHAQFLAYDFKETAYEQKNG
jgi:hypothetical protein